MSESEINHEELAKKLLSDSGNWAGTTADFRSLAAQQAQVHATLALLEELRSQRIFSNWISSTRLNSEGKLK